MTISTLKYISSGGIGELISLVELLHSNYSAHPKSVWRNIYLSFKHIINSLEYQLNPTKSPILCLHTPLPIPYLPLLTPDSPIRIKQTFRVPLLLYSP